MIKKISQLRNTGPFQLFDWDEVNPPCLAGPGKSSGSDFTSFNVLYGENGSGKTTIVDIFRSLNENSVAFIRKSWEKEQGDREIQFHVTINGSHTRVDFREMEGWSDTAYRGRIIIFDRHFVDEYIYSFPAGRNESHEKKTGTLMVRSGEFNVFRDQLEKLAQLRERIEGRQKEIVERTRGAMELFQHTYAIEAAVMEEEYRKAALMDPAERQKQKTYLGGELARIEKALGKIDSIYHQAEEITSLPPLQALKTFREIKPEEVNAMFSLRISEELAADEIDTTEDFLMEGIELIDRHHMKECPFCKQSILKGNEYIGIIRNYRNIPGEQMEALRLTNDMQLEEYEQLLEGILTFQIPGSNTHILDEENRLLKLHEYLPPIELAESEKECIHRELQALREKKNHLFKKVSSQNPKEIARIVKSINTQITFYNQKAAEINGRTEKARGDLEKGDTLKKRTLLEKTRRIFRNRLVITDNFDLVQEIMEQKQKERACEKVCAHIRQLATLLREALEERFKTFVETSMTDLRKYLDLLSPGLSILAPRCSRTRYDAGSDDGTCSFEVTCRDRNVLRDLSDGEKQSIALSFFLTFISRLPEKEGSVIVFDEPTLSLDSGRRRIAAELIMELINDKRQIFVFTGDPFFKRCCLKSRAEDRKYYAILKSASSAIYCLNNRGAHLYEVFRKELMNVDRVPGFEDNIILYGQKLRFCLDWVKDRYLGLCDDSFDRILESVKEGKFDIFRNSIDDLMSIYLFCHGSALARDPGDGQTTWNELKLHIRKFLALGF